MNYKKVLFKEEIDIKFLYCYILKDLLVYTTISFLIIIFTI